MTNTLELCGDVLASPEFSHETHGIPFYVCTLQVERLSGTVDRPKVLLPALYAPLARPGSRLRITGQLRSHNHTDETGSHLLLHAWAYACEPCDDPHENRIRVTGTLCRAPVYRRTPYGREITDLMLCVPRHPEPQRRLDGTECAESGESVTEKPAIPRRCDYLPCICWGSVARMTAGLPVRAAVTLEGRFQSRMYHKVTENAVLERTAYEISASSVVPAEETV